MAAALIGAGLAAAGGLIGELLAGKSREEAEQILAQVRDSFGRIDPAKVQQLHAETVGMDPQYDNAMRSSMGALDAEIAAKGMGIADRAALNDAMDSVGRQERAERAHILRSGDGSGSQALLAALVNEQGAAQRGQSAGLNVAGDAQRRFWQAQRDRFQMGAQGAQQRSALDKWNATNRQDAMRQNNAYEQQRFDNQMRQAAGTAGVAAQQAAAKMGNADRIAGAGAAYGDVAGKAYSQYDADEAERKRRGY